MRDSNPAADTGRTRHDELAARFDADPDAIEWARGKIQRAADQADRFSRHSNESGNTSAGEKWRFTAAFMRRTLLGGETCVIAHFDHRLPEWARAVWGGKAAPCEHPPQDVLVRVSGGPRIEYCRKCNTVIGGES